MIHKHLLLQIREVCERYEVPYTLTSVVGKAHSVFKVLQEASTFFMTLDVSHENYQAFVNITHDINAVETLYMRAYESKSVLPSGPSSSSNSRRSKPS